MDQPVAVFFRRLSSRFRCFGVASALLAVFVLAGCPERRSSPPPSSSRIGEPRRTAPSPRTQRQASSPRVTASPPSEPSRVRIVSIEPVDRRGKALALPVRRPRQPASRPASSQPSGSPDASGPVFSPAPRPQAKAVDPKDFFRPLPFSLPIAAAEKRYAQRFSDAAAMKIGPMEKMFLKQLRAERRREGRSRSYSNQMVRLAGMRYLRQFGLKKYKKMGYRELRRFETVLERYLKAGASPLRIPQGKGPKARLAQQLTESAGYYPMLMKRLGLAHTSRSLTPTQRYWLRTLFLARWGLQSWGLYPLPAMLGKAVYLDYLKARILWTKNLQKRLFALRESRRLDSSFPVRRVLGWVFIQAGRIGPARASLRDAIRRNPNDKYARSLLDKLDNPPT